MKTIVAGSRSIKDYNIVKSAIASCNWNITEVVCGTAPGVDKLGEKWAKENNIPIKYFPADWGGPYKLKAGIVRNLEMANYADALIAIWDGESKGTKHMITAAKQYKLKIHYVESYNIK